MRQFLRPHSNSNDRPAVKIEIDAARPRPSILALSYDVTGKLGDIFMPAITTATRTDDLWKHSCFEAFVSASMSNEYYEFNFSSSTQWAAYRFSGYRSGMCQATEISAPLFEVISNPDRFTLKATLDFDRLTGLQASASWRLGLSAVLEDRTGRISYWALAHPPGRPDFHHSDCFTHELFSPAPP
jgi:hypothetical protein